MQSPIQDGEVFEIISFHNCQGGLGVMLAEYQLPDNRKPTSRHILVQNILTDGRAASDGRLRQGDKLLRINGQPIDGMTLAEAVATLGTAIESGRATLAVSRDPGLAAVFNRSDVDGSKSRHDADGDQWDRGNAGSPEGVAHHGRSVSEQHGFPADLSDGGSAVTQNDSEDARASRQTVGADFQRSTTSSASLLPNLLTDSGSPLSEIGNEPGSDDRGRSFPVCSTPNSSDVAWQTTVESPKSRMQPVGRMTRDTFTDASKVKFEKLEQAMSFLGIHLTKEQNAEIRLLAESDGTGRVDYTKFVQKMRQLLQSRLSLLSQHSEGTASIPAVAVLQQQQEQERQVAPSLQPSPVTAAAAAASGLQTSVYTPLAFMRGSTGLPREGKLGSLAQVAATPTLVNSHSNHQSGGRKKARLHSVAQQTDTDDMGYVGRLQQQIHELECALKAKDQLCHSTELKAASMRKKLVLAVGQCKSLQSRLELAEAAQRASRKAESDYEAVLSALELTLGSKERSRDQMGDSSTESTTTLKKVAILGCQLRKAEESRKVYEVATERLLSFARAVYDTADKSGSRATGGSTEKSLAEGGDKKAKSDALSVSDTQHLADEALNVIKATHSLLETQPLPFGWEEAYTADGKKYYLNHVTEETIWHHPLTKVDRRQLR